MSLSITVQTGDSGTGEPFLSNISFSA
ncbi:MAG: DUF1659 domain-containing protein [Candidatus Riflebacteria bacterium]|nr:DUF1659 domain-containing protein [Candidatus Riflebacteria bacterium]